MPNIETIIKNLDDEASNAIKKGDLEKFKKIVENGFDINKKLYVKHIKGLSPFDDSYLNFSALTIAALTKQEHIVNFLIEKGARINRSTPILVSKSRTTPNIYSMLKKAEPYWYQKIKSPLFEYDKKEINSAKLSNQQAKENNNIVPKL